MKSFIFLPGILSLSVVGILLSFIKNKQLVAAPSESSVVANGFIANSLEGWTAHSSYLRHEGDSVRFELILFRSTDQDTTWVNDSHAGDITGSYIPSAQRIFEYIELPRIWRITIDAEGKCLFRLLSGPSPQGNPAVIPVITTYKK
ncbi:MAG: hypothetical protein JNK14_01120 [Chitinophagaceae bacterium]|nr:hypothetical protein [Chitinophagaceae bacterium]